MIWLDDSNIQATHRFCVAGTPVPWSAPLVSHRGGKRKEPRLIEWQATVNSTAKKAYGPYEPYTGPIMLSLNFLFATDKEELWGCLVEPLITWNESQAYHKKQGGLADRTNLSKAVEDALQGVYFINDTQVRLGFDGCYWSQDPGVQISVVFIKPGVIRLT